MQGRIAPCLALAVLITGALSYLRDPAWLAEHTSGLRGWQEAADGTPYRWSGGHASFFVPSDARRITIPVATTFTSPADKPMMVTFTIDDANAARVKLTNASWMSVTFDMPPRGLRRVRRIDVRTNVTREGNYGVMIGKIVVSP